MHSNFSMGNWTSCANLPPQFHRQQEAGDSRKTMELVFTVVLMALMGSTLYVDGFLRLFVPRFTSTLRLFLGRFNLEPIVRILLHFAFFQFLPLLTSMFSKVEGQGDDTEVLLMLLWMLLVEIIRKKVQGIMLPTDGSSFSRGIGRFTLMDYSDEASRLVWVGFLIYTTLGRHSPAALAAVFVILWSLGLVKLVQRVVNTWLASASWHTARNPLLIAGYMQHVMEEEEEEEEEEMSRRDEPFDMSECKFVVMGEEKLVRDSKKQERVTLKLAATPGYGYGVGRRVVPAPRRQDAQHQQGQGGAYYYCDQNEQKHVHVHLLVDRKTAEPNAKKKKGLVTVGNIWRMHKNHGKLFAARRRKHLEDLCLSFSLFKMLRRRFEHYPMVEVGSARTRKVMLHGLLNLQGDDHDHDRNQRPFRVLQLELDILTNYYQQAAAPVVMSQPILFACNFIWSVIFLVTFIAAVLYILLIQSNYAKRLYCAALGLVDKSFLLYIYLCITMLLLLTVISIETYEFWTLYVFSNWNIVRLLCSYSSISGLRRKLYFLIISVRFYAQCSKFLRWFTKTSMKVQQVSIVDACGALDKYSARATPKQLPAKATADIIRNLKEGVDLDTGIVHLPRLGGLRYGGETTSTEIILATELLEMTDHRPMTPDELRDQEVASVLSKYCMYLVAHVPHLLPDDETWVADRHEDVRSFLEQVSTHYCFIFCAPGHECRKENALRILKVDEEDLDEPTTRRGLRLFRELEKRAAGGGRDPGVWKDLAGFWVSLLIYLAPSNDVQGHARALATWGSDLITCLWAFCTHAGITRQPLDHNDDDGKGVLGV